MLLTFSSTPYPPQPLALCSVSFSTAAPTTDDTLVFFVAAELNVDPVARRAFQSLIMHATTLASLGILVNACAKNL